MRVSSLSRLREYHEAAGEAPGAAEDTMQAEVLDDFDDLSGWMPVA
jgi:hypothetical protein